MFKPPIANLTSLHRFKKSQLCFLCKTNSNFSLYLIANPVLSIISFVITLILASVSKSVVILELIFSLTFAFENLIKYHKNGFFAFKTLLKPKMLTGNCTILSFVIAFISCFLTTGVKTNNSSTVRFILRFKMRLIIMVAPTNFFKTSTTLKYLLCSIFFFIIGLESAITSF